MKNKPNAKKNRKIHKLQKLLEKKEKELSAERQLRKANEADMSGRIKRLNDRIAFIGTQAMTESDIPGSSLTAVEIKPVAYGNYIAVTERDIPRIIDEAKARLTESIARALIEQNIIQFIVKGAEEYDMFGEYGTIGAKLYVVPWEKMIKQGSVSIRRFMNSGY